MMARLRAEAPVALAGAEVTTVQDLAEGSAETTGLPATDGVLLATVDDARVIVRPSGTEPKLKCYIEVREEVPVGADEAALGVVRAAAVVVRGGRRRRLDREAGGVRGTSLERRGVGPARDKSQ